MAHIYVGDSGMKVDLTVQAEKLGQILHRLAEVLDLIDKLKEGGVSGVIEIVATPERRD